MLSAVAAPSTRPVKHVSRAFDEDSWDELLGQDELGVRCGKDALARLTHGEDSELDPTLKLESWEQLYLLDYDVNADEAAGAHTVAWRSCFGDEKPGTGVAREKNQPWLPWRGLLQVRPARPTARRAHTAPRLPPPCAAPAASVCRVCPSAASSPSALTTLDRTDRSGPHRPRWTASTALTALTSLTAPTALTALTTLTASRPSLLVVPPLLSPPLPPSPLYSVP